MSFFTDEERAAFAEFDNAQIQITREGEGVSDGRGRLIPGPPVVVLPLQGCQLWDLSEAEKAALSGEEILLRRKVRLHDYQPELTEQMDAELDGKPHNVLLCSDDGTKSFSILTLRLIKS